MPIQIKRQGGSADMVDLPKPERRAPSHDEMTAVELLEAVRRGCIIQGEKKFVNPGRETWRAAGNLQKRGAKLGTLTRLMEVYRDIGKYKNQPTRSRFPGGLPVNIPLQTAMQGAQEIEEELLADLAAK
ncbi:MAG TPA: hypothetical protein DEB07_03760 [Candidatus Moranbacteria bacterium]|nr:MAG: hypothetical protein A2593_02585 [Candidatus Moranbacteria bacterium RIFOXYD1_FULL_44_9]HBB36558.1 hypothetical protein [Candidatus Moranbacteria bacterium]HBU25325.1 hypothetical protein [Candidatus Moranbacteria bacterium]